MDSGTVSVHFFAAAKQAVGAQELPVPPGSLVGILDWVADHHPGFASVRPRCSYLVDGAAVHGEPAEVQLEAGARVDVLPPFAGG